MNASMDSDSGGNQILLHKTVTKTDKVTWGDKIKRYKLAQIMSTNQ